MTQRNNLYRRPSGIYVLRISIPLRFRDHFGQREIHASTRCRDLLSAKAVGSRLLNLWNLSLSEHLANDAAGKISADKTLTSIYELSSLTGLSIEQVLRRVLSKQIPIVYEAVSQPGFLVKDIADVERDSPETGGFVLNSAMEVGTVHVFERTLKVFDPRSTILRIIETGISEEVAFRILGKTRKREAAFFDLPGIVLTPRNVLILKIHAELIGSPVEAVLPSPLTPAFTTLIATPNGAVSHIAPTLHFPAAHPKFPCQCCRVERAEDPVSLILATFLARKRAKWKLDQQKKMETLCTTFVELMGDPLLGSLDRQMVWDYEDKLRKMPANRYSAARRHGTNEANRLLELAESLDEERLSPKSVERYMDALSSMFAWAVQNMFLTSNPAEGALEKSKKITRAQDDRQPFSESELNQIFSARWFNYGTGERNRRGRLHQFRPHYYWLPLLGLYTGARLNELSQLYIADVGKTETGVHFLDFNLDSPDKTDFDGRDKSLKTVDSQRIVTLHPQIIELGFLTIFKLLLKQAMSVSFLNSSMMQSKAMANPPEVGLTNVS